MTHIYLITCSHCQKKFKGLDEVEKHVKQIRKNVKPKRTLEQNIRNNKKSV